MFSWVLWIILSVILKFLLIIFVVTFWLIILILKLIPIWFFLHFLSLIFWEDIVNWIFLWWNINFEWTFWLIFQLILFIFFALILIYFFYIILTWIFHLLFNLNFLKWLKWNNEEELIQNKKNVYFSLEAFKQELKEFLIKEINMIFENKEKYSIYYYLLNKYQTLWKSLLFVILLFQFWFIKASEFIQLLKVNFWKKNLLQIIWLILVIILFWFTLTKGTYYLKLNNWETIVIKNWFDLIKFEYEKVSKKLLSLEVFKNLNEEISNYFWSLKYITKIWQTELKTYYYWTLMWVFTNYRLFYIKTQDTYSWEKKNKNIQFTWFNYEKEDEKKLNLNLSDLFKNTYWLNWILIWNFALKDFLDKEIDYNYNYYKQKKVDNYFKTCMKQFLITKDFINASKYFNIYWILQNNYQNYLWKINKNQKINNFNYYSYSDIKNFISYLNNNNISNEKIDWFILRIKWVTKEKLIQIIIKNLLDKRWLNFSENDFWLFWDNKKYTLFFVVSQWINNNWENYFDLNLNLLSYYLSIINNYYNQNTPYFISVLLNDRINRYCFWVAQIQFNKIDWEYVKIGYKIKKFYFTKEKAEEVKIYDYSDILTNIKKKISNQLLKNYKNINTNFYSLLLLNKLNFYIYDIYNWKPIKLSEFTKKYFWNDYEFIWNLFFTKNYFNEIYNEKKNYYNLIYLYKKFENKINYYVYDYKKWNCNEECLKRLKIDFSLLYSAKEWIKQILKESCKKEKNLFCVNWKFQNRLLEQINYYWFIWEKNDLINTINKLSYVAKYFYWELIDSNKLTTWSWNALVLWEILPNWFVNIKTATIFFIPIIETWVKFIDIILMLIYFILTFFVIIFFLLLTWLLIFYLEIKALLENKKNWLISDNQFKRELIYLILLSFLRLIIWILLIKLYFYLTIL